MKAKDPNDIHEVVCGKGKDSVFNEQAKVWLEFPAHEHYDKVYRHHWHEGHYRTKAHRCLRETFGIEPDWNLLHYSINIRADARDRVDNYLKTLPDKPYVLLHYEGNTSTSYKNLSHEVVKQVCDYLIEKDITPIILDWDFRSHLPDSIKIFCPNKHDPLWLGYLTGDGETIGALIERSACSVMIDSGPQKVALALPDKPLIAVWTRHHPLHFCDRGSATHFVPVDHIDLIRGDKQEHVEFFRQNFNHVIYNSDKLAYAITAQLDELFSVKDVIDADAMLR